MKEALSENLLERFIQQLDYPKVLIIDELGCLPLPHVEVSLFLILVTRSYEHASLIVPSNKSFLEWRDPFQDPILATAVLDRLLYYSTILNIKGNSYCLKENAPVWLISQVDTQGF